MKTIQFLMVGLVSVFLMIGCGEPTGESIASEQVFTVTNSLSSTYRIVDGQAGVVGELLGDLSMSGDGIHKGASIVYNVDDDKCDKDWRVWVYYNDPGRTACTLVKSIPCNGSVGFMFNNTNCSHE